MPTPDPCAGRTMPLSPRPHWLCRGGNGHVPCPRWQYGITGGITPRFIHQDGVATCADKVVVHHPAKVGDPATGRAPEGVGVAGDGAAVREAVLARQPRGAASWPTDSGDVGAVANLRGEG